VTRALLPPSSCSSLPCSCRVFEEALCKVLPIARSVTCRKIAALAKSTASSAKANTTCASVWMGSTIARTAGKHAMSLWPAPVATDRKTFRLFLDADPRLAAAAGGVARYLADVAGLENGAVARLQSAVIAACTEAFEYLTPDHPRLEITFTRLPDRMEVALTHRGEGSPAVGLDTIAGFAARIGGTDTQPGVFAGFDRVQYETHGGEAVTRLTKYFGQVAPSI